MAVGVQRFLPVHETAKLSRRSKWLIGAGLLLAGVGAAAIVLAGRLGPALRGSVVEAIARRFASDVELKSLDVSMFPMRASGQGLILRQHGRTDVPPLISIDRFSVDGGLLGLITTPKRVRKVRLDGLRIIIPKGRPSPQQDRSEGHKSSTAAFLIEEIVADGAVLQILPKDEGKDPLTFDLYKLTLRNAGKGRPMSYRASLKNAKPPGMIETTGEFGPWQSDEPSETPVSGNYTFRNADLSVFKGISGKLSSDGKFRGQLGHIEADGFTDTPDFALDISSHSVHLKNQFHAIIDGGDGDTLLQPVDGQFLNSTVQARGGVTGTPQVKGKTVDLDATVSKSRLEDMLQLAMKSDRPFMKGDVNVRTKIVIPPGDRDVVDKLILKGAFDVSSAKFLKVSIQDKVDTLSRRGKGETDDTESEGDVASNLKGTFQLKNGVMEFSKLSFRVPGALIQLHGTYGLRTEAIDFHGTAQTDAKLSEMTTGFKSFLLRAGDPFFKKNKSGAVIPIKITGTRSQPAFGLELRK
ncbi:MAG TPA: AsmA-like C-terminal region-containing protein [Bryobacteraceae bacterium]|nr:AsmA-like C-terminal region-containing protein [Bryobacteraceae bacterium]